MTTAGQPQRSWTEGEIAAIHAGASSLPGRSSGAIRALRIRLDVRVGPGGPGGRMLRWSTAEDDALRAGATTLPGRTYQATWQRRCKLGLTVARASAWSADEVALLRAGARSIAGRSYGAVMSKRVGEDVVRGRRQPRERVWSAAEVALLDQQHPIPGRSAAEVGRARATRLGLATRPARGVPVLRRAREASAGEVLLEAVRAATPRALGGDLRGEVIAEAVLHILEHGGTPTEAVASVLPATRRAHNALQRGCDIDGCFWLADPNAAEPLVGEDVD